MKPHETAAPTAEEMAAFSITALKGIECGLGQADQGAVKAQKLAEQYPDHLVLIQAGKFLHAYDRSAHILGTLKGYKVQLVGNPSDPHLRVGFPMSGYKRRLWPLVAEFGTPYVVLLGTKEHGQTVYVSDQNPTDSSLLQSVSSGIVMQIINDLSQRKLVNQAAAVDLLANPDSVGFKLKSQAQAFDTQLTQDIIKMPRDLRAVYGENLRVSGARLIRHVHAYGQSPDKTATLREISTEIDVLKHYLTQAPRLNRLKFNFEDRVGSVVELGRLTGGLQRSAKVAS